VKAFAAEVGLNADELAREYRARFEAEPPAGLFQRHDWPHRLSLAHRFPALLVTIVGILICGSLILECGRLRDGPTSQTTQRRQAIRPGSGRAAR